MPNDVMISFAIKVIIIIGIVVMVGGFAIAIRDLIRKKNKERIKRQLSDTVGKGFFIIGTGVIPLTSLLFRTFYGNSNAVFIIVTLILVIAFAMIYVDVFKGN